MNIPFIGSKVKQLRQKFSQSVGLPIRDALPASQIEAALEAEHVVYRRCLFDRHHLGVSEPGAGCRPELSQSDFPGLCLPVRYPAAGDRSDGTD